MSTPKSASKGSKSLAGVILSTFLGNALEFYDFTIYAVFAKEIGEIFFPTEQPVVSLLASWGTFAAGFIMRPLGALLFSQVGDTRGRRAALSGTIILMGLPTLMIGLLPGYHQIGILAPLLLIFCRMIQGLSAGGEYNGAAIFAIEHTTGYRQGLVSGILLSSCVVGALLALFSGQLVHSYSESPQLWRLTFIFGALVSFLGFILRHWVHESPEYISAQLHLSTGARTDQDQPQPKKITWGYLIQNYGFECWLTFLLGAMSGSLSYILFGFMSAYSRQLLQIPQDLVFKLNLAGLICYLFTSPLTGHVQDRVGKLRYIIGACILTLILSPPLFFILKESGHHDSLGRLIFFAPLGLGVLAASMAAPSLSLIQDLFPVAIRFRGVAVSYSLGMALLGGSAPFILMSLIYWTSFHWVPALYVEVISIVTLLCLLILKRRGIFQNC